MARFIGAWVFLAGCLRPAAVPSDCAAGTTAEECALLLDEDQTLNLVQMGSMKQTSSKEMVAHASPAVAPLYPRVAAYVLPPLPYGYDALEPAIDAHTMRNHHDKHHNTYVTNLNKALVNATEKPALVDLQTEAIKKGAAVRNNGGGAYNHNLLWLEMAPFGQGGGPSPKLAAALDKAFGSLASFKDQFQNAGAPGARFGSGWVWLIVTADQGLSITSTSNQDNPLMVGADCTPGIPILGADVWEHAYYLKYEWDRAAYLKAWWDVVNWSQVSTWYEDALLGKPPAAA